MLLVLATASKLPECFIFCSWNAYSFFIWQKNSLATIKNIANVCCVQFSAHSSHLLAFGSADYRTYCYDLRNARAPWCVLAGHEKAVSYVKFLDSGTLVTASTDNKLKLWDLKRTSHSGPSTNACSLTFSGHTNEKVGICRLEHNLFPFTIFNLSDCWLLLACFDFTTLSFRTSWGCLLLMVL